MQQRLPSLEVTCSTRREPGGGPPVGQTEGGWRSLPLQGWSRCSSWGNRRRSPAHSSTAEENPGEERRRRQPSRPGSLSRQPSATQARGQPVSMGGREEGAPSRLPSHAGCERVQRHVDGARPLQPRERGRNEREPSQTSRWRAKDQGSWRGAGRRVRTRGKGEAGEGSVPIRSKGRRAGEHEGERSESPCDGTKAAGRGW